MCVCVSKLICKLLLIPAVERINSNVRSSVTNFYKQLTDLLLHNTHTDSQRNGRTKHVTNSNCRTDYQRKSEMIQFSFIKGMEHK